MRNNKAVQGAAAVIDGVLAHSPAEHVRRPAVPAESPTPGFTHLQVEALLTAARESPNLCDFAQVAMPGLLGSRIFEATSADIGDLGEEYGHRGGGDVHRSAPPSPGRHPRPYGPEQGRRLNTSAAPTPTYSDLHRQAGQQVSSHESFRRYLLAARRFR